MQHNLKKSMTCESLELFLLSGAVPWDFKLSACVLTGRQYVNAREHFQYACVPEDYGQMLVEVSTSHGRPREADLFLAQAVLQ